MPSQSAGFCVTVSVAVGSQRDGSDATGHKSIIEPYPAQRADFTKEFANSTKSPICFSRPPPSTTRPSLRSRPLEEFAHVVHGSHPLFYRSLNREPIRWPTSSLTSIGARSLPDLH